MTEKSFHWRVYTANKWSSCLPAKEQLTNNPEAWKCGGYNEQHLQWDGESVLCLACCCSCSSVLAEARVADVRHADWYQGPSPEALVPSQAQQDEVGAGQPGLELLSELWVPTAWAASASWVREWMVPGCSGQRRFNLDRTCSKGRVGMYIPVCAHTALAVLLARLVHIYLPNSPARGNYPRVK